MKTTKVGTRGVVFTFDDFSTENAESPTNVYVINGDKHIFVCDTFLGPESMKGVLAYIDKHFEKKPIIIFNSHYDFDHHWGNCAFDYEMILAHSKCKELITENGEKDLEQNKKWLRGEVKLTLPTATFNEKYSFDDEEIIFFYTPGHTEDSASCYDLRDKILFVGDNLEMPIPYIRSDLEGVKIYLETLRDYLNYDFKTLIPGHGHISDKTLLDENLNYLDSFPELAEPIDLKEKGRQFYLIHMQNLSTLAKAYINDDDAEKGILYYQKLVDLEKTINILSEDNLKYFTTKIDELKNQKK